MTNDIEKVAMLAEILDENINALPLDKSLDSLASWDSLTKLSLIALFDRRFGKPLTADQIKSFKTVGDIVKAMD